MAIPEEQLPVPRWTEEEFVQNLQEVLDSLMGLDRVKSLELLAPTLGVSKSTIYRKRAMGDFNAVELHRLGEFFGIEPDAFFQPVEQLRGRIFRRSGSFVADTPADLHGLPILTGQIAWDDAQLWPDARMMPRAPAALQQIA